MSDLTIEELRLIWHILCEALARRTVNDSDPEGREDIAALTSKVYAMILQLQRADLNMVRHG